MRYQLRCTPFFRLRFCGPIFGLNRIRRAKEDSLRVRQLFEDGLDPLHTPTLYQVHSTRECQHVGAVARPARLRFPLGCPPVVSTGGGLGHSCFVVASLQTGHSWATQVPPPSILGVALRSLSSV